MTEVLVMVAFAAGGVGAVLGWVASAMVNEGRVFRAERRARDLQAALEIASRNDRRGSDGRFVKSP